MEPVKKEAYNYYLNSNLKSDTDNMSVPVANTTANTRTLQEETPDEAQHKPLTTGQVVVGGMIGVCLFMLLLVLFTKLIGGLKEKFQRKNTKNDNDDKNDRGESSL
ncbi:MAG: hypothetical protein J5701_07370 [Bacteroidales bacterium]|nr:hypothetical protein [Bacteroidales bacterium]